MGKSREIRAFLQVRLPVETRGNTLNCPNNSVPLPVSMANQKSALRLDAQGIYYRSVMQACNTHVTDLITPSSSPTKIKLT